MRTGHEVWRAGKDFLYRSGRLLDRRRYEFHFEGGSKDSVLAALTAYQNEDGGFGSALEPDLRGPDSQPIPTEEALLILDELGGREPAVLSQIAGFVERSIRPSGGLPSAFFSVNGYPHAPWWETKDDTQGALNPTGRLIGLLLKHGAFDGKPWPDWLTQTMDFLWEKTASLGKADYHDWIQVLTFLEHAPDRERAAQELQRLKPLLLASGAIEFDPYAEGYVHPVLNWAPSPSSLCRSFFTKEQIDQHLDALVKTQQEDGGWNISFPAQSPAAEAEWRSYLTIKQLLILRAYGRLE
ncbi:hypothetical protein [Gorillibacterium sp. CAU 1737]|uniref:hypothetical protein n=1 Tax=Gorillibacterium sp. CAU 1737 TaxID=3140362 RepID=UPI003260797C